MARRISLPSSDELFADRAPYAARSRKATDVPREPARPRARAATTAPARGGGERKGAKRGRAPKPDRRATAAAEIAVSELPASPPVRAGRAPAGAPAAASKSSRKAARPTSGSRAPATATKSSRKPARTTSASRAVVPERRRQRGLVARIDRAQARLADLPIDALLELRDGLESLLVGGGVGQADVERLLSATDT